MSEDVRPALKLSLGVGQSVSTIIYYVVLIFGLMTALVATGFKVGELALVFGALGIGIVLGLQDVAGRHSHRARYRPARHHHADYF